MRVKKRIVAVMVVTVKIIGGREGGAQARMDLARFQHGWARANQCGVVCRLSCTVVDHSTCVVRQGGEP